MRAKGALNVVVYIASPYTVGDVVVNIRAAIDAAEMLSEHGFVPIVPCLNFAWHLCHPHSPQFWYAQDLVILGRCNVVLRIPGESFGADAEVEHAGRRGIPTFVGTVPEFIAWWNKRGSG